MRKTVKVIMLPAKDECNIGLNTDNELIYSDQKETTFHSNVRTQHLCLTSDEEIKEGDHYYLETTGKGSPSGIYKSKTILRSKLNTAAANCSKIIATTDKSLAFKTTEKFKRAFDGETNGLQCYLPQIPQSFIEAYVKAQGKIEEVEVEYKNIQDCTVYTKLHGGQDHSYCTHCFNKPIIRTKEDNTVIIHLIEEKMYTRVEVHMLLNKMNLQGFNNRGPVIEFFNLDNWIEENL